jgi:hypothetical protein
MLSRRRASRVIVFAAVGWLLAALLTAPAFADPPPGGGECPPNDPNCSVWGHDPGNPGNPGNPGHPGGGGPCMWGANVMPCSTPFLGAYQDNGCYWKPEPFMANNPPPFGMEGRKGTWGVRNCCTTPSCDFVTQLLYWIEDGKKAAPPNPEDVARTALAKIRLDGVQFAIAPDPAGAGLVGLPVWLATEVNPSTWGPNSASATERGLTVNITARGSKIVWAMGDGTSVTCTNPGTPYKIEYGAAHSPDCGYVYPKSSRGQASGRYTITATTTFEVAWEGGGLNGVIVTTRTAQTSVRIDELQVVTE